MKRLEPPAWSRRRGFTLVELMVALGVSSIILTAIGFLVFYSGRSFAAMGNYVDLDSVNRHTIDQLTREIRQVRALTSFKPDGLTFLDADGKTLQYVYNPASRELSRIKNGITTPLLTECDNLKFSIHQRTPLPGTGTFFPASSPAECKLIALSWKCSRTILGKTANTESVQTALIVIRNKQ